MGLRNETSRLSVRRHGSFGQPRNRQFRLNSDTYFRPRPCAYRAGPSNGRPVGTRERRVLASFRRSDPPQEGVHQGVVVEIEGVHVDVGGQWTVFNKDRDRLRGGLNPTVESIGVVAQRYPKLRRMSTQRDRAGRQLPVCNRRIGRYPVRDFTMGDIGILILS